MTATRARARGRSPLRVVALVVAGLVVVGLAVGTPRRDRGGELDPDGTGPRGARALVLLLGELGADVDVVRGAPPADATTALVLRDRLTDGDRVATLDWVDRGGVLVTTARSALSLDAGLGRCPAALADVEVLPVDDDGVFVRRAEGGEGLCFDGLVRAGDLGAGSVVSLATMAPLTNELLAEGDAAVLAAALLAPAPGGRVAVLDGPGASDARRDLIDLVDRPVRLALLQGAVALGLWVLWRGRRLGSPIVEEQPVSVAGSQLVVAVGRLLESRRRPDEAAEAIRADVRRALEARLGLPSGAPIAAVAAAVAARTTIDEQVAAAALGDRPVLTDDDLLDVVADLDRIRAELLGRTS